jgi:hypothetical protein
MAVIAATPEIRHGEGRLAERVDVSDVDAIRRSKYKSQTDSHGSRLQ